LKLRLLRSSWKDEPKKDNPELGEKVRMFRKQAVRDKVRRFREQALRRGR
jgi:hypothetical protein